MCNVLGAQTTLHLPPRAKLAVCLNVNGGCKGSAYRAASGFQNLKSSEYDIDLFGVLADT